jgi:hypothetical protein
VPASNIESLLIKLSKDQRLTAAPASRAAGPGGSEVGRSSRLGHGASCAVSPRIRGGLSSNLARWTISGGGTSGSRPGARRG